MADPRIRVYDGRLIDPFNPKPEDVIPENFIHSSSVVNRYCGNTMYPYSIGQHSNILVDHVPAHLQRAALIHDWAECWFNDLAQPVKMQYPAYREDEHRAMRYIGAVLGVSSTEFEELDYYDKSIYIDERNALMRRIEGHGMGDDRKGLSIEPARFAEKTWREVKHETELNYRRLFLGE